MDNIPLELILLERWAHIKFLKAVKTSSGLLARLVKVSRLSESARTTVGVDMLWFTSDGKSQIPLLPL